MGFGASANRTRSSEDTSQNTTQALQGQRSATFDSPQAQQLLQALQGVGGAGNGYTAQAGNAYGDLASGAGGGVNPHVEDIIQHSNQEGDNALNTNLAKVRAGGYRGGTGASMYGQGKVVADASNQRALGNANLRYGAFNDATGNDITRRLAGASGLAGIGSGQQGLAAQLLALLRGENVNQTGTGTAVGTASGTKSGTEGGFKFGTF